MRSHTGHNFFFVNIYTPIANNTCCIHIYIYTHHYEKFPCIVNNRRVNINIRDYL